jgi:hypothetical protein
MKTALSLGYVCQQEGMRAHSMTVKFRGLDQSKKFVISICETERPEERGLMLQDQDYLRAAPTQARKKTVQGRV